MNNVTPREIHLQLFLMVAIHSHNWTLNLDLVMCTCIPCEWQPRKTRMSCMAMLATVAPTPLILFCGKHVVCYLYFCSHLRGVSLGIPTRPWILWYISIQNCTTNHVMYMNVFNQYKIVTLNISSREETIHIFRNMTTPSWMLELYGVLFARTQFINY